MRPDSHEIFSRRRSRNLGLGLVLGAFVVVVFAVTIVKLTEGQPLRGLQLEPRTSAAPAGGSGQ